MLSEPWTVAPPRSIRRKLPLTITLIVFVFGSAVALFHSVALALLAPLALFGFIADNVVPSTFHIDETGAKVTSLGITRLEIPWSDVRCVLSCARGLKLSPFENPVVSYMDDMRGVRLIYKPEQAKQIEALVFFYRKQALKGKQK